MRAPFPCRLWNVQLHDDFRRFSRFDSDILDGLDIVDAVEERIQTGGQLVSVAGFQVMEIGGPFVAGYIAARSDVADELHHSGTRRRRHR